MDRKVILYLAIFFATLAFFEVEAQKPKNKLAKKAYAACEDLTNEVKELNQTVYGLLGHILYYNNYCLFQVDKKGGAV